MCREVSPFSFGSFVLTFNSLEKKIAVSPGVVNCVIRASLEVH